MKFSIWFFTTALVLSLSGQALAETEGVPVLPGTGSNIREVTLSQIFRYGREMYRYGNYPEAVKAFKEMLSIDCSNSLAQYHLMKIARKSPEYKDLDAYLKNLSCPVHNFNEEDFLPASLYYLADADLMQEQLTFYNKRYRLAKATMADAAQNYGNLTKELEEEISSLRQQLASSGQKPSSETSAINQKISDGVNAAARMDSQVSELQKQLAQEREQHQKELTELRKTLKRKPEQPPVKAKGNAAQPGTQDIKIITAKDESIAELKERLAKEMTGTARPAAESEPAQLIQKAAPEPSPEMNKEVTAKLEEKERELEAKDRELATLQEKFEDIQKRLRLIQASVESKNTQIKALQTDMKTLQP